MIIEISLAVIALAFVALVIYLIAMIKTVRVTLGQVNQTLVESRKQISELGIETKKFIEQTNGISADFKHKMNALNPMFNSVSDVGEILETKTAVLKKESLLTALHEKKNINDFTSSPEEKSHILETSKFVDVIELIGTSIRLWQKLKKRS